MAENTLESSSKVLPKDLVITSQPDSVDKDKFRIVASGLKIDEAYAFQFQYVYEDGTTSDWSPGYTILTPTETIPGAPTVNVPSTATGSIPVTLDVFPTNAKRVDIYIAGGQFGTGTVVDHFLAAGTKNIAAVAGVYTVSLITVTPSNINGLPSTVFTVTVSNVVTEDTTAPDPIVSAVPSAGIRPGDSSGQLGYISLAITNGTIPSDFAGYIVKIQGSTNSWTQTFNSSTALSSLYIGSGILVGQSYSLSVATTDGKNISSYVNSTPSSITVTDTRTNTSTVTGSLSFSATDSILTVSWSPSTDANVDSYRVQVTTNADTNFTSVLQEVYSKGTTATFGGLSNSTTYRVRVTTKFGGATGALSTQHTIGTFTMDASGAISDGIAPTTNPSITTANIKSLFGAFAITFPAITNTDDVKYEVFIKPTNATGIVDNQYKVLEVGGTFAVVKTLADKTTALSYGTDYYIAIRAKDNDGISTGTVTAVGPVQTLQVQNADLAADSVYANNIKAGEIDATKLVSDVVLASQKITVGSNSALDRVRLDATNATIGGQSVSSRIYIGGGNYYDTASPFYADNLGRLSIGQALKFESGTLTINGSGTFTGTVTAGAGGNTVKVGNDVNGTNDGIYIGATGDYIYTDGTIRLGNGGITYSGGTLTVTGNVTATSLSANATITSPTITGGSYKTSSTVGDGSASSAGIKIDTTGIYGYPTSSSTASFSVSNTGVMTANSGTIGGWTIGSTVLRSSTSASTVPRIELAQNTPAISLVGSDGTITISPSTGITGPNQNIGGSTGPGFSLTPAGNATLRGTLFSESGKIGGWTIGTSAITGGNTTLNSSGVVELVGTDFVGNSQTMTLSGGVLSIVSSGSSIFANGVVYISGRNIGGQAVNSSYSAANIAFNDPSGGGVIGMDGSGNLQLSVGSGDSIRIIPDGGLAGATGTVTLEGRVNAIFGFKDAVYTNNGSSLNPGAPAQSPSKVGVFRNIGAGTGAKTSSDTDGLLGDIWIQYT